MIERKLHSQEHIPSSYNNKNTYFGEHLRTTASRRKRVYEPCNDSSSLQFRVASQIIL